MERFKRPQRGCALPGGSITPEFRGGFDTIASMQARDPHDAFQVYCDRCNVTAPAGTRRCIHCGGRLPGARGAQRTALTELFKPELIGADEEGEEFTTSIGSAGPKVAMWILLLIGGFLYRLCG